MKWARYHSVPSSEKGANNEPLLPTVPERTPVSLLRRWPFVLAFLVVEVVHVFIIFLVVNHFASEPTGRPPSRNSALNAYSGLASYNTELVIEDYDASEVVRTPANDEAWRYLGPKDGGMIRIPLTDAETYGLPQSGNLAPLYPQDSVYQLAVFHQMHCLVRIRDALLPPEDGKVEVTNHTLHCVEYLRKTILCNADTTLDPTDNYLLYGVGSTKSCRDWRAVWDWWEDNKFDELSQLWEQKGYSVGPNVHVEGHSDQY